MASVTTNTHTNCKRKQARPLIKLNGRKLVEPTIRKELIEEAKTLTTSNHCVLEASQQQAIHAYVTRALTKATTENNSSEKQWKS